MTLAIFPLRAEPARCTTRSAMMIRRAENLTTVATISGAWWWCVNLREVAAEV
jgi:hypothetical protein